MIRVNNLESVSSQRELPIIFSAVFPGIIYDPVINISTKKEELPPYQVQLNFIQSDISCAAPSLFRLFYKSCIELRIENRGTPPFPADLFCSICVYEVY